MRGFLITLLSIVWLSGCSAPVSVDQSPAAAPTTQVDTTIGFRNNEALREHYSKHGREFGEVTRAEYLFMAQELRDTEADRKSVLVAYRPDGVITKFDRRDKEFIAYNRNLVIRTFFKPGDGERYFHRQKGR